MRPLLLALLLIQCPPGSSATPRLETQRDGETRCGSEPSRARLGGSSFVTTGSGDVVLFLIDDLGWATLNAVPTPTIDALKAQGTTYTSCYTMPVCSASRYALLFGQYGRRDGVYRLLTTHQPITPGVDLAPERSLSSLADLCKARGYRTAFFGKWHAGLPEAVGDIPGVEDMAPLFFGFDEWLAGNHSNLPQGGVGHYDWLRLDNGHRSQETTYADQAMADSLGTWWQSHAGPRFAMASFRLVHAPFEAPPAALIPPGTPLGDNREVYEAMLMATDTLLDQLLVLDEDDPTGVIDLATTTVIVLSDNGTPPNVAMPLEASDRVKTSVYEGGIRVPFIAAGPGIPQGDASELIHFVDFLPTFASVLALPEWTKGDGIPFWGPMQPANREWLMCEYIKDQPSTDRLTIVGDIQGTRFKLWRENGVEAVYSLSTDPTEMMPLAPSGPVYDQLRAWEGSLPPRD